MSKSDDEDKEENFFGNKNNNIMPLEEQEVFRETPSPNPNDKDKENEKKQKTETKEKEKEKFVSYKDYYSSGYRDPGKEGRKASRIIFLRSFNNWVKASMINKYCKKLGKGVAVLELCCGKGGDLDKYFMNNIKLFVGADISKESLKNAMDRLEKIKNEKYKDNFRIKCIFIKDDLSSPDNRFLEKINKNYYFDLVSCQFALHYHFQNEKRLNAFLTNVSSRLCEGGFFIGTIIEDNVIVKRLRNRKKIAENKYLKEKFTFGNEYYSVKFSQKHFDVKNGPFGIKYGFYLEDSIDNRDEEGKIKYVEEYLIVFNEFVELCKKYDLYLVEKENFTKFYSDYVKMEQFKKLSERMLKDLNNVNIQQQWEIIQLYMVFAFRKGKEKENNSKEKNRYIPYFIKNKIEIKNYEPELNEGTFD
jgi:mRNA (guanine-N7-)-methyltransferase